MNHLRQLLLTAALSCALFSCSSGMTRDEAAKLITAHYGFPYVEVERVTYAFHAGGHLNPVRNTNLFGGIQIGQSSDMYSYQEPARPGMKPTFWPTELGNAYLAPYAACDACIQPLPGFVPIHHYPCVATAIWELKEVTGISQEGKVATVEYVAVATHVNTIGKYNNLYEGKEETRTATMRQFDDGSWRVENEKPKYVVKPGEIIHYASQGLK